jgi:predicted aldo/keto reductase-like oxidoreductase
MQYRKFGKLDWQVSALGFGCMRLPTRGNDDNDVDVEQVVRMVRYAIDHGVNYLDTGYFYSEGNSERALGVALQDGYRERVKLADKLPAYEVETHDDFGRVFEEQLERMQTDHLDLYLLHGIDAPGWHKLRDLGVIAWAEDQIAKGRIGHLGFSFHDSFEVFQEIVDAHDNWTMCQIQYNYLNENTQAGTRGLEYAAAKGLAVAVMEPLLGGKLANPPQAVQAVWESALVQRTPVEWALNWLWHKPEVSVVLSGMSTMEQVEQNVASASASGVGMLSDDELALIARARAEYDGMCPIPCTQCNYCMPCPNGVDIPRNFGLLNDGAVRLGISWFARNFYGMMPKDARAGACIQCRECEEKCPQQIAIGEWMPVVHAVLGEGKEFEDACALVVEVVA